MSFYWISGNRFDSQRAWSNLLAERGNNVNVVIMHCGHVLDTTDANRPQTSVDVIDILKRQDILDDRPRIIKLKGVPEDYQLLVDYLDYCSDTNTLVIDGPVGYRQKPPSKRWVSLTNSKLYKAAKSNGKHLNHPIDASRSGDAVSWLNEVAEHYDRKVSTDASYLLVETKGKNLDTLYADLLKLFDYEPKKEISTDDVSACCVPIWEKTVWDFIDELDSFDYDRCMLYLQHFYAVAGTNTSSTFYGDVSLMLGALYQHYLFPNVIKDSIGNAKLTRKNALLAVDGLFKKTQKSDGSAEYKEPMFSEKYVTYNINKPTMQTLIGLKLAMILYLVLATQLCDQACRRFSNDQIMIKLFVNTLVMYICGKLTFDRTASIFFGEDM